MSPAPHTRPRPLTLMKEHVRGEAMLMLEGSCRHSGDLTVNRVVGDLSDVETAYGKCGCGAWVVRTTWLGSRGPECYETRMMSPHEVDVLTPKGKDR